jgi:hypothetical protein
VKAGRKLRKDPLTRKWVQATFALLYLAHICRKISNIVLGAALSRRQNDVSRVCESRCGIT